MIPPAAGPPFPTPAGLVAPPNPNPRRGLPTFPLTSRAGAKVMPRASVWCLLKWERPKAISRTLQLSQFFAGDFRGGGFPSAAKP